ncbi:MAG: RNA methyltransferase, partial [Anaerolineae bacterium]|nr:RNA methyltransferase [Anaerolineae bacterium]
MITSPQNPRIKLVRGLQRRAKLRRQEQRLVLEGARLLRDAVEAGVQPDFVCYTAENDAPADPDLVARLESAGIACLPVADALMREMADTDTPQGILGVVPWPDLPIPTAPDLVIVADGWRDPGNVGTLLRTAAAAGVDLVVLLPGTVDPFNPKTLRAGMGAHFRVPVLATHWPDLLDRFPDRAVYVAEMGGQTPYYAVDWTRPSL